ncbi:MAG TPA: adenosine kinase [Spirochaetales bacterium]|nr:adenosine kinase [Spirochaetales bacterium]
MKLACVGNALLDVIAFVDQDLPTSLGLHPGSTNHVDKATMDRVVSSIHHSVQTAGGGAANTARAFSALGGVAAFAGAVGDDAEGRRYASDMQAAGITPLVSMLKQSTGIFLAMISPDGMRTVVVHTGAAAHFSPQAVPDAFFSPDAVLYADGFLASEPERLRGLIERGKAEGMRVALDVGGHRLASANADFFRQLIRSSCDWVFMNEDEFVALAGGPVDACLKDFSARAKAQVLVKRAEVGSVCWHDGQVVESPVRAIRAVDSTGAGDGFSAGFLAAALSGWPLARCMRMGNRVAEYVIQVPAMSLEPARLRAAFTEML